MRSVLLSLAAALAIVQPVRASVDLVQQLSIQYKFFIYLEPEGKNPARFIYADAGHIHAYVVKPDGEFEAEWETTSLGGRAKALLVTDLENDGKKEIVVGTSNGRVLIYSVGTYDLLWENLQDRFESVEAIATANIDRDPQEELIIVANQILYIYDGKSKAVEWQSIRKYEAQEIILGNVDDDEQLEIILNTGFVIDSRFYNIEFESDNRFGDRIRLMDINNDGVPEIIGQRPDFTLMVFDIYAQREIW
jgi:hypothetical protein